MAAHQHIAGFIDAGSQVRRPPMVGMAFLHERPVRAANFGGRSPLFDPKYLVSLLFGHARLDTRANAAPALPRVRVTLTCLTPAGKPAVEIRL